MHSLKYLLQIAITICLAITYSAQLHAQSVDDEAITLSEQETARLRAILEQPIDPNALKATRVEAYKQKQGAAWKLGDVVKLEEILREWVQMDSDIDPRWRLMSFLFFSTKRQEAFQLGQDLVKEIKYAPSAVRIRAALADQYMHESNLKQAGRRHT